MRKLCVLGFALGLAACGGEDATSAPPQTPAPPPAPVAVETPPATPPPPETPPPAKPSLAEMELAAIKGYPATLTDPAKIASLYANDAAFMIAGKTEVAGREAIQKAAADFNERVTSPSMAIPHAWVKGNTVAFDWVLTGTDKETGKPFGLTGASVLTFNDDGLITKDHSYVDHVTLMKQTGKYKGETPPRPIAALPSGALEVHTAKTDSNEEANVASAKALTAAWSAGDTKTMLDKLADGVVFEDYTDQAAVKKKDIGDVLNAVMKSTTDRKATDATLIGVEDFTIDEQEVTFTQKADFVVGKVKIPNKKKTLVLHSLEIDQWKDGKIVKGWNWSNGLEPATQLGIGPAAAKPEAKKPEAKKPEAKKPEPAKAAPAPKK